MKTAELPFKVRIATPCPARWSDMNGDDRIRFCTLCQKNVYNLSAMTSQEAIVFLKEHRGPLCARVYQRKDGTVITSDCPLGIRQYWARLKRVVCSGAAVILFAFAYNAALARDDGSRSPDELRNHIVDAFDNSADTLLGWLGLRAPAKAMGGMASYSVPIQPLVPSTSQYASPTSAVPDKP